MILRIQFHEQKERFLSFFFLFPNSFEQFTIFQSSSQGGEELDEEPEAMIVEVEEEMEYLSGPTKSAGVSSDEAYIGFVTFLSIICLNLMDYRYFRQDEDFFSIQITIEAVKSVSFLSVKSNEIVIKLDIKQMRQSLQALIDCLPKMSVFMAQRTVPLPLIKQLSFEIIRLVSI